MPVSRLTAGIRSPNFEHAVLAQAALLGKERNPARRGGTHLPSYGAYTLRFSDGPYE